MHDVGAIAREYWSHFRSGALSFEYDFFLALAHLAFAARRAISLRFSGAILRILALPPN